MLRAFVFEPVGQSARNMRRAIVAEKLRPVCNGDLIRTRCHERLVQRGRDVRRAHGGSSLHATM